MILPNSDEDDQTVLADNTEEDLLKSAKAEMNNVREENERLKLTLSKIMKDYQSLRMHFHDIIQQEDSKNTDSSSTHDQEVGEPELVSLRLGRSSNEPKKDEKINNSSKIKDDDEIVQKGLALGLECKFDPSPSQLVKHLSPENSDELKELGSVSETLPPSNKSSKTGRSEADDDVLQQNPLKKARVSVRVRCDTPTMNDGCHWRKYGQKIAKGNPCPRAYYRCTMSPSCPVRKQVQRCADDMSILTTTYEGTHDHPLPVSATAMASTTSAAVSMLNSTSSTSSTNASASTNLHGLNLTLTANNNSRPQFSLSNSSISSSSSQSHQTITLDLTAPNSTSSTLFNRNSTPTFSTLPRQYSPTCLSFSSQPNTTLQTSWANGYFSNFATNSHNRNQIASPYQPYSNYQQHSQNSLTDKIAVATTAITNNPSFQSALADAIKSFIGNTGATRVPENRGGGGGENSTIGYGSSQNSIGCGSSYLSRLPPSSSQQPGSLNLFPPSTLSFSAAKSASGSPTSDEGRDRCM